MTGPEIIEAIGGLLAVGTVVFTAGRFTESVKANTKATEQLSVMIDGHLTWSAQIVREHDERFHDHDTRLSVHDTKIAALEENKRRLCTGIG